MDKYLFSIRKDFLSFSRASIGDLAIEKVVSTLRSEWITTGPLVRAFENRFGEYHSCSYALAVNSCTAAMHISLIANEVGSEDEVVTSPLTFCSTVNVIEHVGARPVLADVDIRTGNIDPEAIVKSLSRKTKVIIPVHYGGLPCLMDEISDLARRNSLFLLEDVAHSVGAEYKGKKIGADSGAAAYSFYATKNMTTGEGGMLVSSDEAFIEKCRTLALHGMSRDAWKRYEKSGSWRYEVVAPGFKYNMPDIMAAIGIEQLKRLDSMNQRRAEIANRYHEQFDAFDFIEPFQNTIEIGTKHAHHLYPIVLKLEKLSIDRDRFIDELRDRNIGTSVHFIPIHFHPYYKNKYGWKRGDFPNAEYLFDRFVSLPIYPLMTDHDVDDVISAVYDVWVQFKS